MSMLAKSLPRDAACNFKTGNEALEMAAQRLLQSLRGYADDDDMTPKGSKTPKSRKRPTMLGATSSLPDMLQLWSPSHSPKNPLNQSRQLPPLGATFRATPSSHATRMSPTTRTSCKMFARESKPGERTLRAPRRGAKVEQSFAATLTNPLPALRDAVVRANQATRSVDNALKSLAEEFAKVCNKLSCTSTELLTSDVVNFQLQVPSEEMVRLRADLSVVDKEVGRVRSASSKLLADLRSDERDEDYDVDLDGARKFRSENARLRSELNSKQIEVDELQRNTSAAEERSRALQEQLQKADADLQRTKASERERRQALKKELVAAQAQLQQSQQETPERPSSRSKERKSSKRSASEAAPDRHMRGRESESPVACVAEFDVAALTTIKQENVQLKSTLNEQVSKLRKLDNVHETQLKDWSTFVERIADSSACKMLDAQLDLDRTQLLGNGNLGWVMTAEKKDSGERVVLKLQGSRRMEAAMNEWCHGSEIFHKNVVKPLDMFMHRDVGCQLERRLAPGYASGMFAGKVPKIYPEIYLCMTFEFMDYGTVRGFMEKHFSLEGLGAVARQVGSAVAFMHARRRTHNDIKPDNILLKLAPDGTHLIVKLADFGMAAHSTDRNRDCDLFAYTLWCLALGRKFHRCPSREERADAIMELKRNTSPSQGSKRRASPEQMLGSALVDVVSGLWQGDLTPDQVESREEFQDCELREP